MRHSWTDDRLDDLSRTMVERFDKVEGEMEERFSKVEAEMDQRFDRVESEMDRRSDAMDRRFDEMGKRVDRVEGVACETRDHLISLQRTMLQVAGGLIAGNLALLVGVIGVVVTRI